MSVLGAVRSAAELAVGDVVRTPRQMEARVVKHITERVILRYITPDSEFGEVDEVTLRAEWLVLLRRAGPVELPKTFFAGERR